MRHLIWVDRDGRLAARAMPEERLMARMIPTPSK